MDKQVFAFNMDASYWAGVVYSAQIKGEQLTQPSVVVTAASGEFTKKFPDIFEKYCMLLCIGQVAGYYNEMVVATGGQKLGVNVGANVTTLSPHAAGKKGIVAPPEPSAGKRAGVERTSKTPSAGAVLRTQYNEEKTALIVGGVSAGLLGLWLVSSC